MTEAVRVFVALLPLLLALVDLCLWALRHGKRWQAPAGAGAAAGAT